jgi:L-histidine Nalpha-methyltransferase
LEMPLSIVRKLVLPGQISDNLGMSSVANVAIHSSQFPENVRRDLLTSLRDRRVNHKFLYDSVKQTQKWLALHQAYSPSRNDVDCAATYYRGFEVAAARMGAAPVHVIGLGCGGGQKDACLLKLLQAGGRQVSYTPCDVSTAMVLVARQIALEFVPEEHCFPLVCDLASAEDTPGVLTANSPVETSRLITFFGMIPNFEPEIILPKLAALVRPQDWLLFSANLAPGDDYPSGVRRVLPQYDNPPTRDWLMTFLLDLGVERSDGELRFEIKADPAGGDLQRIMASFQFNRGRRIQIESDEVAFNQGDALRLFFSYRYAPTMVSRLLHRHGLEVSEQWITRSEEEGVFLVKRG